VPWSWDMFYRKRIFNLFKEIISGNSPTDLLPDVKYAYDNFLNSTIHYFKTIDNNDIIQTEYDNIEKLEHSCIEFTQDSSLNMTTNDEADKLLMRKIKNSLEAEGFKIASSRPSKLKQFYEKSKIETSKLLLEYMCEH
jgi:hypothetical protein